MNVRKLWIPFLSAGLVIVGIALTALSAPEEVGVGAIRAVLPRAGAPIRQQPRALSRATASLAHGTKVRVVERRGAWIRVTQVSGGGKGGWLRASQTVEPFALTQGGQRGRINQVAGASMSAGDIQAAGRQFDPDTESSYRTTHPDLDRFFPQVDGIEESAPSLDEVLEFIRAGRLGRPGRGS